MTVPETGKIRHALRATVEGLDAAGYQLDLFASEAELEMRISANEGVCEDCLVPKRMFIQMVNDELAEEGLQFPKIKVLYPSELA